MKIREIEDRYLQHAFAGACAYEAVAIVTDRVPTISALVRRMYEKPAGRFVLWGVWGYLTVHLFGADF